MHNREVYIDIIRILACLMVIMMHSPSPLIGEDNNMLLGAISLAMLPCNALFFMSSGALLIDRSTTFNAFMKRRLSRIAIPVIFWSVLYTLCYSIYESNNEIAVKLAWIPFHCIEANGTFWFMYALLGCYFLIPIIGPWLTKASSKEIETVLLIWFAACAMPMFTVYLGVPMVNEQSAWYYFGGFFGYMILGYYLSKYDISWKAILAIAIMCICLCVVRQIQKPLNIAIDCYRHPFTILYSVLIFVMIKKLLGKSSFKLSNTRLKILEILSACTFGVYLIHVFILRELVKPIEYVNSLPLIYTISIRWLMAVPICFVIVYLIRKLPYSKYIIG